VWECVWSFKLQSSDLRAAQSRAKGHIKGEPCKLPHSTARSKEKWGWLQDSPALGPWR